MIDIHSHILPNLDDGAMTESDSLDMARKAIAQGIHTIVATPHHKNGAYENDRESILMHTDILNKLFDENHIPLTLLPGQETRINGDMIEDLAAGRLLGINDTKYLFVELPDDSVPRYTRQMLFDIQVAGYTPIIVHPERNRMFIERPERLYEFVMAGVLTQVTAGSVVGKFGKTIKKFTGQLIENNLTHFVASDAHNTTTRNFWMKDAFKEIQNTYGIETHHILRENSQLMIDGMNVNNIEPSMIKKKKIFGLF